MGNMGRGMGHHISGGMDIGVGSMGGGGLGTGGWGGAESPPMQSQNFTSSTPSPPTSDSAQGNYIYHIWKGHGC